MSLVFAIAIYFVVWWIVLFAVLPFGVRTQEEAGDVVAGTPPSAPAKFSLLRVVVINTIVAFIVFALIWAIIEFDLFDVAKLANQPLD
jgi:predicted secreted protein